MLIAIAYFLGSIAIGCFAIAFLAALALGGE